MASTVEVKKGKEDKKGVSVTAITLTKDGGAIRRANSVKISSGRTINAWVDILLSIVTSLNAMRSVY